jgi:hypothetical protein
LPGAYLPGAKLDGEKKKHHIGGKPLWLMRELVRDYTKPGNLVCDPCAGGGTTLIAASIEGREAIGAELDTETHNKAQARIAEGYTPDLFSAPPAKEKKNPVDLFSQERKPLIDEWEDHRPPNECEACDGEGSHVVELPDDVIRVMCRVCDGEGTT